MRLNPRSWQARALFRLDEFLALAGYLILFAVVLLVAGLRRLWRLMTRRGPVRPSRVLFLSSEGHKVAPTRVRSYHFARTMRELGVDAFVLAYWDEYARLHHFPFPFRRIWETEKFFFNLTTLLWLLLKGPLIIIEQRPNYGFPVPLCLKLLNGSRVFMDIDDWILDYLAAKPFVRLEVRHLLSFFGRYAEACVVSSRRLALRLSRNFPTIHILPTYVDHRRFTPPPSHDREGPVVFSWVGTIFQNFTRDNVLFVIEAFARACDLLGTRQGLRLDIVGGGDFFEAVREQARTRFAGYPVQVLPWLDPDAMPDYLRSIDVGLYSLVEPSLFQESKSPTKIFEYYACAKPVISTVFGEAQYFVVQGETGLLADNLEDYAQGIARLCREPEARRAMGREGRRRVEAAWNMEAACATLKDIVFATDATPKEH
jgi:glycosyltransferase involved in cell wall biosynthesis